MFIKTTADISISIIKKSISIINIRTGRSVRPSLSLHDRWFDEEKVTNIVWHMVSHSALSVTSQAATHVTGTLEFGDLSLSYFILNICNFQAIHQGSFIFAPPSSKHKLLNPRC